MISGMSSYDAINDTVKVREATLVNLNSKLFIGFILTHMYELLVNLRLTLSSATFEYSLPRLVRTR